MYRPDMAATKKFLSVFGDLGRFYLPAIWDRFEEEGMHQNMFLTEWIMTVFTRNFGFEFVTRVWDIFLFEGMKILYRICLGLLKCIEPQILSLEFEGIMKIIRRIPQDVDIETALECSWAIPIHRSKIQEFNDGYEKSIAV
jgi:TBC1 domain family member 10